MTVFMQRGLSSRRMRTFDEALTTTEKSHSLSPSRQIHFVATTSSSSKSSSQILPSLHRRVASMLGRTSPLKGCKPNDTSSDTDGSSPGAQIHGQVQSWWRVDTPPTRIPVCKEHIFAMEAGGQCFANFLLACKRDALDQADTTAIVIQKVSATVAYFERNPRQPSPSYVDVLAAFEGETLCCSLERFIKRMIKYGVCSPCNIVIGLLFLQRIHRTVPCLQLSPTNIQRLLLISIMVASKTFDDLYYSNKYWGKIGDLTLAEVTALEVKFLGLIDFRCSVQREEYDAFVAHLSDCDHLLDLQPDTFTNPNGLHTSMSRQQKFSRSFSQLTMNSPVLASTESLDWLQYLPERKSKPFPLEQVKSSPSGKMLRLAPPCRPANGVNLKQIGVM